jgi:hypothetical protein
MEPGGHARGASSAGQIPVWTEALDKMPASACVDRGRGASTRRWTKRWRRSLLAHVWTKRWTRTRSWTRSVQGPAEAALLPGHGILSARVSRRAGAAVARPRTPHAYPRYISSPGYSISRTRNGTHRGGHRAMEVRHSWCTCYPVRHSWYVYVLPRGGIAHALTTGVPCALTCPTPHTTVHRASGESPCGR